MKKTQGRMKFGVMNDPFVDPEAAFKFAKKLGLSFVDFTVEYPITVRESINPKLIKRLSKKYGFGLIGHTSWRVPIGHEIESIREASVAELKKTMDLFKKIGIKKVNVHCDNNSRLRYGMGIVMQQHIKSLRELARHAGKNRQTLMLENTSPFLTFKELKRVFDSVPGLKLHLDIGHANLGGGEKEIRKFILKGRKLIEHIHIHDNCGKEDEHLFLGMGNINWKKVIKLLKKIGYDKTITLETFIIRKGEHFKRANKKEMERYFRKQLMLLEKLGAL